MICVGKIVAKRGLVVQANQNVEELASFVQGCTLACTRAGDGGPYGTTTPTSAAFLGIASDCTLLELQTTAQSDSAASTGVVFRALASAQDPSEDEAVVGTHPPSALPTCCFSALDFCF